ncbi:MAG: hypothetical protein HOO96_44815 [Polyangiaceae bacterium]|nr:hypothetical protein [Polyangiaceae bacterium]
MHENDPWTTWQALVGFRDSAGRAYVVPCIERADEGYMACNLRKERKLREPDCGQRMPFGRPLEPADLATVDTWLGCGAPFN